MYREIVTLCEESNKEYGSRPLPIYAPVSVKDEMNMPAYNPMDCMSNTQLFLSEKNIYGMRSYIVARNVEQMTRADPQEIQKQTTMRMIKWARETNIDDYEDMFNDTMATLRYLNKKFVTENGDLYDINGCHALNMFHNKGVVTNRCGTTATKKYDEMTAGDYHTIDLWKPVNVTQENNMFRYKNEIPMWQKSMNRRHYSRENDGLHAAKAERASLNNQLRGYDMTNIYKGNKYYENYFYENL